MTEGPPRLVADPAALAELLDDVRSEPVIALDTESNSFHVYRERVCLLQISTRAADFVVDPLAVDVTPLGAVLCDGRETVLHGADYDVRCLKREYGWRFPRLFDTMAAARRLGRPQSDRWNDFESRVPKCCSTRADRPSPGRPSRRAAAMVSNRRGKRQPYSRLRQRTS